MVMDEYFIEEVKARTRIEEGLELKPYRCPAGYLSIGYGLNLDAGIDKASAEWLMDHKIREAVLFLEETIETWFSLPKHIKAVCLDMMYNHGVRGFRAYKKMIAALNRKDYRSAALEIRDSNYWRNPLTNKRAERNAKEMERIN